MSWSTGFQSLHTKLYTIHTDCPLKQYRITESLIWKRPSGSWSPTFEHSPPCQLQRGTECHVQSLTVTPTSPGAAHSYAWKVYKTLKTWVIFLDSSIAVDLKDMKRSPEHSPHSWARQWHSVKLNSHTLHIECASTERHVCQQLTPS